MNAKHTWTWLLIAGALLAFILLFERHWGQPPPGPAPLLPNFKATAVTAVTVQPAGEEGIHLERTNATWTLTRPVPFPAQKALVENLLTALERLVPSHTVKPGELPNRPQAEAEYGFDNAPVTLNLQQGEYLTSVKFGRRTAPGDQMFVRVVGREDIYVVDVELLNLLPRSPNEWRDTSLVNWAALTFDRITITNVGKVISLQSDATNSKVWRLTEPMNVRADYDHLLASVQLLRSLSITRFVSDKTNADLDTYGLAPPSLSLVFANGTNPVASLHFGKTNEAGHFFARREGLASIVTVTGEALTPWRDTVPAFRDHQLLALPPATGEIEVQAAEKFTLQRGASNVWQLAGQKFRADPVLVAGFLATLENLKITQFFGGITDTELLQYGLTTPGYQVSFRPPVNGATSAPLAQLFFGTNQGPVIYARRADESSVYAVPLADYQQLPGAAWQLRERRLWNFAENDLARVVIRQDGKTRELIRNGTNSWSFASGSQGILNGLAMEMAVRPFGELTATAWVARGASALAPRYGITTNSLTLTFELKHGEKLDIAFGALSPAQYPYARVTLEGEPWVFEFSTTDFELVLNYLTIPASVP